MPAAKKRKKSAKKVDVEVEGRSDNKSPADFPIVGIGASAGGLEAFSNLLHAVPSEPGFALIFIPHLDPTHESAMVDLLSRATRLPVRPATDGARVMCNVLYVLPPNSDLTIEGGVLHLIKREAARGHHLPIDTFFRSLAIDKGANAVGVILSGTASDGTLGLSSIKDCGGITFAQDPESAKYEGMPSSAILAGVVDYALPPARIAQELIRIAKQPAPREPEADNFEGKDRFFKEIFRHLKSFSRVDFVDYKTATIRRRILRRMNINEVKNLAEYVKLLERNPMEVEALYRDVLINVTSFFRNPQVFESLRELVYPKILAERSASEPVRVWVPGCSTGEETYSHAISLVEMLSELRVEVPIQIFGTDLSENAINKARIGTYKETIANDVSEIRLRRFFHRVPEGYQISKSIRDMCVFACQNVFSDPPFSRMDLISCRNLLIYLGPVLQKRVIPIFHYALKDRGFLLVGNTEGLLASGMEIFDLMDRKNKIYQKKPVPSPITFGMSVNPHATSEFAHPRTDHREKPPDVIKTPMDVQREADRLLLTRYVPSAVVVNEDLEIVQTRGRTNRYLELPSGKASLNLLKMARPGLFYELRALVEQARKKSIPVSKKGVVLQDGPNRIEMELEVIPFRTPARDQRHFLVLFEENDSPHAAPLTPPPQTPEEIADSKDVHVAQLKQEIASTKEYLQSIIESQEATNEELQSANEEIQSGNEELQSTNEELQTSQEELESANEELNTVNEEIQQRNQQLTQFGNDLINLLHSVRIPVVMLGQDLHIRRFTPEAERVLGFSSHDVGKSLSRLPLNLDLPQLERWMLDVMRDVTMHSEQVNARDGKTYQLRITPYRTLENKIDGVVLTLVDITDLVGSNGTGI